jgi:hypothetical protein
MKKIMVFICYLLASLNNTKINAFKFDLAYCLHSTGTSNEGLNTLANLGATTTVRAVDLRKKITIMSDTHGHYVDKALSQYSESAPVLNFDIIATFMFSGNQTPSGCIVCTMHCYETMHCISWPVACMTLFINNGIFHLTD